MSKQIDKSIEQANKKRNKYMKKQIIDNESE